MRPNVRELAASTYAALLRFFLAFFEKLAKILLTLRFHVLEHFLDAIRERILFKNAGKWSKTLPPILALSGHDFQMDNPRKKARSQARTDVEVPRLRDRPVDQRWPCGGGCRYHGARHRYQTEISPALNCLPMPDVTAIYHTRTQRGDTP